MSPGTEAAPDLTTSAPATGQGALIEAGSPPARERLLGLEAWERALLAAHHGGCAPLFVCAPPADHEALGARLRADARLAATAAQLVPFPPADRSLLVLPAGVLVDPQAVRALRAGEAAPPARGVWLTPELPRGRRARALLRSLANPCDGVVDTWVNRPLSRVLTRLLIPSGISPNAVTVLSCLIALGGAGLIATGEWRWGVLGALLFQLGAAVDCVDGEIARLTYRFSPLGARLDLALDNVSHVALFAAMAAASHPALGTTWTLALGALAVLGCAGSFALVYRLAFAPAGARGPSSRVRLLLDKLTNRDFSLLVIGAALVGWWQWLLLVIAAGTWVFGAILLLTVWRDRD